MSKVRARRQTVATMLRNQRWRYERAVFSRVDKLRAGQRAALLEMQARLSKLIVTGKGETFSAFQLRLAIEQVRESVRALERSMGASMRLGADEMLGEGARQTRANLVRLESVYKGTLPRIPVAEGAVFAGAYAGVQSSLLASIQSSVARYGGVLIAAGEQALMQTLLTGGTQQQAANAVQSAMQVNWWQAERIARTEYCYAFSAAAALQIRDDALELGDLMGRWSELVDDLTGAPYDDRVAADSLALHGQIARPGGSFTMPVSQNVSPKLWGKSWQYPPNRPQDRACLGTWRPHWYDIPAWYYSAAGGRVDVTPAMRRAYLRASLRGNTPPDVLAELERGLVADAQPI